MWSGGRRSTSESITHAGFRVHVVRLRNVQARRVGKIVAMKRRRRHDVRDLAFECEAIAQMPRRTESRRAAPLRARAFEDANARVRILRTRRAINGIGGTEQDVKAQRAVAVDAKHERRHERRAVEVAGADGLSAAAVFDPERRSGECAFDADRPAVGKLALDVDGETGARGGRERVGDGPGGLVGRAGTAQLALDEVAEHERAAACADGPGLGGEREGGEQNSRHGQFFLHAGWSELQPRSQQWKKFPSKNVRSEVALFFTSNGGCALITEVSAVAAAPMFC